MTAEGELRVRRDAAVWREIDGETVVLDVASGSYLGLNATGSQLWGALVEGASRADLVSLLVQHFAVTPEEAGRDVDQFLDTCRARGLVE
ncbi:coenzyme PQQ synthesis protein D (PqqD) [Blastococcus colisei]|uniref:Coenzyme PQQ synthesis protein D (PqqD) n=1 Tax=Blastococcus colisei TaxID=1564162 RepID=A0A543P1E3_9ACTN|nr:PqqD family protein [Blastococcus colisei]TQN37944.1 coenzyme PQQ synthesis protein D (PqqD) [Blastococcus colisei]